MIQTHPPPTRIERNLWWALEQLGITHEPQTSFGVFTVDEYLPDYQMAIEADGCSWHGCHVCGWASDQYIEHGIRQRMKKARRDWLLKRRYGLKTVVHIWGHNLTTVDAAIAAVEQSLASLGIRT